jgi:hypothetical protein
MITALFMGWTKPNTNIWFPIRKMTWSNGEYHTVYLQGMLLSEEFSKNHQAEIEFQRSKLDKVDSGLEIHGLFRPRIPLRRTYTTDVKQLEQLNLTNDSHHFDPFEYVARTGGYKATDSYDLFPEATPDECGIYHFYFTAGVFYPVNITEYITQLKVGDRLNIKNGSVYHKDFLLDKSPGYINDMVEHHAQAIEVTVEKINFSESGRGNLLCAVTVNGKIHIPFSDFKYQSLAKVLMLSK